MIKLNLLYFMKQFKIIEKIGEGFYF